MRASPGYSQGMTALEPRIGHGYDLHRLEPHPPAGSGQPFVLGGVTLEHEAGPIGHSDGDALLHAITDALLGGLGEPDIGQLFPDTDPHWHQASSDRFLKAAASRLAERGYRIGNLDCTVICERPKLIPHKARICSNIATLLGIDLGRINLKGKTHEGVDAVGERRAIEVHVVALLLPA